MDIGVIAENKSDVEVLDKFMGKLIDTHRFSLKKRIGHGCGPIRKKCNAWAINLIKCGCCHLIVLHDLDDKIENELRSQLEEKVRNVGFEGYVVLIPKYEIEAWLLYDNIALKSVFNLRTIPRLPFNPELIVDPKKALRDIIWKKSKKHYINTIHNVKIAEKIRISRLVPCQSFQLLPLFTNTYL